MDNTIQQYEEKISRLSADFELFAHITSHDLRDPLRQAIIDCEAVHNGEVEPEKILSTIDSINQVLKRISLLREYSYIANFSKEYKEVDCNDVLKQALENLKEKIDETGAKVDVCDLPKIKGYESHILMLFEALVDNAIKFNESFPPEVKISCEDKGEQWEICFADNGIGLDEVYKDFVFSLFQRLEPEVQDGSYGAGLAFAKKIVENHGGKIWFESDGENGTKFHFTLRK